MNVPSFAVTEIIIGEPGRATSDEQRETTRKLLGTLSETEISALWGDELPFDPTVMRRSIFMRWRLELACSHAPTQGPIDFRALNLLLEEADAVLTSLKEAPDSEGVAAIWEKARFALARDASKLAELEAHFKSQSSPALRAAPAPVAFSRKTALPARPVEAPATPSVKRRGGRLIPLVFVLVVLAGVVFHTNNPFTPKRHAVPMAGAKAGFVGVSSPSGVLTLVAGPDNPLDPQTVAQLEARSKEKGQEVQRVGPRAFLVLPPGLKAPAPEGAPHEQTP